MSSMSPLFSNKANFPLMNVKQGVGVVGVRMQREALIVLFVHGADKRVSGVYRMHGEAWSCDFCENEFLVWLHFGFERDRVVIYETRSCWFSTAYEEKQFRRCSKARPVIFAFWKALEVHETRSCWRPPDAKKFLILWLVCKQVLIVHKSLTLSTTTINPKKVKTGKTRHYKLTLIYFPKKWVIHVLFPNKNRCDVWNKELMVLASPLIMWFASFTSPQSKQLSFWHGKIRSPLQITEDTQGLWHMQRIFFQSSCHNVNKCVFLNRKI